MKTYGWVLLLTLMSLPSLAGASFFEEDPTPAPVALAGVSVESAFSPADALSPLVVSAITSAKKSIRVAADTFVSKPVSEALVNAMRAGKDVKIVLNQKNNESPLSAAQFLMAMSLPPHVSKAEDRLHADYIVIDGKDVVLGNIAGFTDEDDEKQHTGNVLVLHNVPALAKQYLAQWQSVWQASEEMKKPKS